jgi:hypothetical protein
MTLSTPPIVNSLVDKTGKATIPWVNFFKSLFQGDNGTALTLTPHVLTGTATATGVCYRLSSKLYYVRVNVVPNGSITTTAGLTYLTGFPFSCPTPIYNIVNVLADINSIGCGIVEGGGTFGAFMFLPAYTGTDNLTITGIIEAS